MPKRNEGMFTGRARRSMEKPKSSFGYLNIPEDLNVFKPEGDTEVVFDIIPYIVSDPHHLDNRKYDTDAIVGEPWWKRPVKVHRSIGADNVSLICPGTIGKKCPICEYFTKKRREGAEWDEIKDYLPSNRTIYAIVPIDTQECETDYTEGEIHIMDQPDHYFDKALQAALDKDITAENFADPEQGLSLRVYFRVGKFGKVEFAEAVKVDFLDRDEQFTIGIIEEAPDLDGMMKILPYKEIDALFYGMEGLDDEDIDDQELEEEPPKRERTRRTSRAGERKEPEEETGRERTSRSRTRRQSHTSEGEKERTTRTRTRSRKPREETDDEDQEPSEPKKRSRTRKEPEPQVTECPHGHVFGEDNDKFEDCENCEVWEDCKDEKEAL